MKVVILSGGFGTRLSEYTEVIPKPMVRIGNIPILVHIMNIYSKFDQKDFYLALGYKSDVIKDFFLNYREINSDFSVNLKSGELSIKNQKNLDWDVTLVNTGLNTFTGGRIKRMKEFIGNETFLLTYGDGLADIDIDALISFHKNHGKMVTVTAVHPVARFGELDLKNERVVSFKEKPQIAQGWINGGYFVIEPEFFEFIEDDLTILEKEPLEQVTKAKELKAFKHEGFWQCMDHKLDKDYLEQLILNNKAPWIK